tara:strand:- start:300 stop:539 length:240 start_codon:yes stop_codon:yes gene_type:complete
MKTFYNTSEVSVILREPQWILRFWQSKHPNFIKPVRRNNNPRSRRYYREEDIHYLKIIKNCVREHYIHHKGINKILSGD